MRSLVLLTTTAAAMIVLTSGCSSNVSAAQTNGVSTGSNGAAPTNVPYTVASGLQNGIENQQFQVITSDAQFAALASLASMSGDLPTVDYSKDELVAVFLGPNAGCGTDGLSVENVDESDVTVSVYVKRTLYPPPNGVCTVLPLKGRRYALLTIPKTSQTVSLRFL
jgi:hypothetical protein